MVSIICKCVNKVACGCVNFFIAPSKHRIVERDLREWKRIEGIDQYNSKRN